MKTGRDVVIAGLRRALVSSSDDEGTQRLHAAAPDLVIPGLRPYRRRGEISTWMRDESVLAHVEDRLARYSYASIGEFHLYGADADLPIPRRIVQLARRHGLILHAHSDADAIERIFVQDPDALVLWAHSGFERPDKVRAMLRRYRTLHADLAYRSDMGSDGRVDPEWLDAFREFPGRFMVGTDTFTPERLHFIPEHAKYSRGWLAALPADLAERIAWRNGEDFVTRVWDASRARRVAAARADGCASGAERDANTRRVESGRLVVFYRPTPEPIRVGQPFAIEVDACPTRPEARVEALSVDARMPAHGHGMNYAPSTRRSGPNRFSADGLLFHMSGHWELLFDVRVDGRSERLSHDAFVR